MSFYSSFYLFFCALIKNQVENVGHLADKPKALHVFRVVTKGHIYLMSAKSAALKKDWMKVSKLAKAQLRNSKLHRHFLYP